MVTVWWYFTWSLSNKTNSQVFLKQPKINIYGSYWSSWRAFWRCIFLMTRHILLMTMFFLCLMIVRILGTLSPNLTVWKWMQHAELISVWNLGIPCQFHFINKYEGHHSVLKCLRNVHPSGNLVLSGTCGRHFLWLMSSCYWPSEWVQSAPEAEPFPAPAAAL